MANKNQTALKNSPNKSRLEELNELSDAELRERYLSTFAVEPEKSISRENLIDAINDGAPKKPAPVLETEEVQEEGGKYYGNKDTKKQYPIQKDWKNKVVVRQTKVERSDSTGEMVRLESTAEIQTYDREKYEKMLKDNFFTESRMEVQVLHMPK